MARNPSNEDREEGGGLRDDPRMKRLAHLLGAMDDEGRRRTAEYLERLAETDDELTVYTLEEIASAYPVSVRSLHRHIAAGDLRSIRLGRKSMIRLADWRDFLARQAAKPHKKKRKTRRGKKKRSAE